MIEKEYLTYIAGFAYFLLISVAVVAKCTDHMYKRQNVSRKNG